MSLKYKQVTIGAAATQLATAHTPCTQVIISNGRNTHTTSVGDKNVTSTTGILLSANNANNAILPLGSYSGAAAINLDDIWVAGTQNDVVDVLYFQS